MTPGFCYSKMRVFRQECRHRTSEPWTSYRWVDNWFITLYCLQWDDYNQYSSYAFRFRANNCSWAFGRTIVVCLAWPVDDVAMLVQLSRSSLARFLVCFCYVPKAVPNDRIAIWSLSSLWQQSTRADYNLPVSANNICAVFRVTELY